MVPGCLRRQVSISLYCHMCAGTGSEMGPCLGKSQCDFFSSAAAQGPAEERPVCNPTNTASPADAGVSRGEDAEPAAGDSGIRRRCGERLVGEERGGYRLRLNPPYIWGLRAERVSLFPTKRSSPPMATGHLGVHLWMTRQENRGMEETKSHEPRRMRLAALFRDGPPDRWRGRQEERASLCPHAPPLRRPPEMRK